MSRQTTGDAQRRRHLKMLTLAFFLGACPFKLVFPQPRDPTPEEHQALDDAIEFLRAHGEAQTAKDVEEYLKDKRLKIQVGLGYDGFTKRRSFRSPHVILNRTLFSTYRRDDPCLRFSGLLWISLTLVHEMQHAEGQSLLGNAALYLGQSLTGRKEDVPEWDCYNKEWRFLQEVFRKVVQGDCSTSRNWNEKVRSYNRKAEDFGRQPSRERAQELLRATEELMDLAEERKGIVCKYGEISAKWVDLADGYQNQVKLQDRNIIEFLERRARHLRSMADTSSAKISEYQKTLEHNKKVLQNYLDRTKGIPGEEVIQTLEELTGSCGIPEKEESQALLEWLEYDVAEVYAKLSRASGFDKLGAAAPYFLALSRVLDGPWIDFYAQLEAHHDVAFEGPVAFTGCLRPRPQILALEAPPVCSPVEVHLDEAAIISALAFGNTEDVVEAQVADGLVSVQRDSDCAAEPPCEGVQFVRGDADANGQLELTDAIRVLSFLFQGGLELECFDAADADDSGELDISDGIRILQWLFLGGTGPAPPSPDFAYYTPAACGLDPTDDALDCRFSALKCEG